MPRKISDDADRIIGSVDNIGISMDKKMLGIFLCELLEWNGRIGLVSRKNTSSVVTDLIGVSAAMWDFHMKNNKLARKAKLFRVVDIGSGGGFPGMIWKFIDPGLDVTFIERRERKAFFIEKTLALLGVKGARVLASDAAIVSREEPWRGQFDTAIMLAVAPPENMAKALERLISPTGAFCTMRGSNEKKHPDIIGRSLCLQNAEASDRGTLLLYKKTGPASSD